MVTVIFIAKYAKIFRYILFLAIPSLRFINSTFKMSYKDPFLFPMLSPESRLLPLILHLLYKPPIGYYPKSFPLSRLTFRKYSCSFPPLAQILRWLATALLDQVQIPSPGMLVFNCTTVGPYFPLRHATTFSSSDTGLLPSPSTQLVVCHAGLCYVPTANY